MGTNHKQRSLAYKTVTPKIELPVPEKQEVDKLRELIGYESVVVEKEQKPEVVPAKAVPAKKAKPTKP